MPAPPMRPAMITAPYHGSLFSPSCIVLILCSESPLPRLLGEAARRRAPRSRCRRGLLRARHLEGRLHRELDQVGVAGLLFFAVRDVDGLDEVARRLEVGDEVGERRE